MAAIIIFLASLAAGKVVQVRREKKDKEHRVQHGLPPSYDDRSYSSLESSTLPTTRSKRTGWREKLRRKSHSDTTRNHTSTETASLAPPAYNR
ncbi:hypothetical protein BD324DRAFT_651335 [Kockovaella imperatae]|uniref:Uncharacterized protein n=1 Tax=Kockovaella imperatae TaxID=4999 RepID=A0A1Y1UH54_9TREE|nr:hypothetical protein BD324DRAFT_651335 [Kockovaella imperatae]ORX36857.1 hypothetical protein BD324DRAFT_651335 [Kockovaella imperatae]